MAVCHGRQEEDPQYALQDGRGGDGEREPTCDRQRHGAEREPARDRPDELLAIQDDVPLPTICTMVRIGTASRVPKAHTRIGNMTTALPKPATAARALASMAVRPSATNTAQLSKPVN